MATCADSTALPLNYLTNVCIILGYVFSYLILPYDIQMNSSNIYLLGIELIMTLLLHVVNNIDYIV